MGLLLDSFGWNSQNPLSTTPSLPWLSDNVIQIQKLRTFFSFKIWFIIGWCALNVLQRAFSGRPGHVATVEPILSKGLPKASLGVGGKLNITSVAKRRPHQPHPCPWFRPWAHWELAFQALSAAMPGSEPSEEVLAAICAPSTPRAEYQQALPLA